MKMLDRYFLSTAICRMAGESAIEFATDSANAAPVVVPTVSDIKTSITSAASAAIAASEASQTSGATLPDTLKSGWQAFSAAIEADAISLGEEAASAFGGPIAGAAADLALPDVVPMLAQALGDLFKHIGAALPTGLDNFLKTL